MFSKYDEEFMCHLRENAEVDQRTGNLKFKDMYVAAHLSFFWKEKVFLPHSHVVWFLTHNRWPKEGYIIDHVNNDAMDNRPENLQEITHEENQKKRRGRLVFRSYGKGKYGYGLYIFHDKRDGRFYVSRSMSRGHGKGDLKSIKYALGGFNTREEAEAKVSETISAILEKGLDYIPPIPEKNVTKETAVLDNMTETFREMRHQGMTLQEIQDATGFKSGIYNRIKDINIDGRSRSRGEGNASAKLTENEVRQIRKLRAEGKTLSAIGSQFNVSKNMIHNIIVGKAWAHVKDEGQ